jgi:methylenetetrahydrofolate dehydrogenase (NADP+)/methenyltetrahydrofolate cyclohydrolase
MNARIIDGKAVSDRRRTTLAQQVQELAARGLQPCLAAVTVRADHGWSVYQRNQATACAAAGIQHRNVTLAEGADQEALFEAVEQLNVDPSVHGIIVQSPLPEGFDALALHSRLSPGKDVECVGPANLGLLLAGTSTLAPCTALSAVALAREAMPELRGVEAVVIGASTIVGKPIAQLLTAAGATVTLCQITTRDVASHCRRADLVIVAVGKAGLVRAQWIKPGATVIDVGINRITAADGKTSTVGDVAAEVAEVAGALSPVPGGVGALTTTILLESTVAAAQRLTSTTDAIDARAVTRLLGGLDLPPALSERIATLLSRHLVGSGTIASVSPLARRLQEIHGRGGAMLLDGAMGTELIARGIAPAAVAEANRDHPDLVLEIHRAYLAAGAEVLTTNTFALNRFRRRDREELIRLLTAGVRLARQAAAGAGRTVFILGSIGPLGSVVGAELEASAASDAVAEIALALADAQVDGFTLETMPSTLEASAALAGIRRVSRLPVLVARSSEHLDAADLAEFAQAMENGGASAIGINCAAGPRALRPLVAALVRATRLPVLARPNAGFPSRAADGRLTYHLRPDYLLAQVRGYVADGVGIVGGCCGVGPRHIQAVAVIRGAVVTPAANAAVVVPTEAAVRPPHALLQAFADGSFPVLGFVPGRLPGNEAQSALSRLAAAGAAGIGLLAGWPGSVRGTRLVANLAHLAQVCAVPAILELSAGETTLALAEDKLIAAHLLGIRTVLIDAGVFVCRGDSQAGADAMRLLWLVSMLNRGRNRAGNHQDATAFAVGVRVPAADHGHQAYIAAGADFLTLQPVYDPLTFREVMETMREVTVPVLAEVLLLPDAATADELDNELPALSVPEALKQRLVSDPQEDVRGVLRFLAAWRTRLSGVCVLAADARVDAAEQVIAAIRRQAP